MDVRSSLWFVVALVACRGGDDRTAPPRNVAPVTPTTSELPAGWARIDPTPEQLRCANWSKREWRVAIERGAIAITPATEREPNTGPALPFALPNQPEFRGRRHVLPVSGGFLVGLDAGEWGGSLHWFSANGQQHTKLAGENVRGLVAFGDAVVSIEGLSHLSMSEGNARWLSLTGGAWHETALVPLDAGPETFAATKDAIYVLTLHSLVRLDHQRTATVIQPVEIGGLYPDSMTIDDAGRLWVGMRLFVLRLSPGATTFETTWLVPEGCRKMHMDDKNLDCICDG